MTEKQVKIRTIDRRQAVPPDDGTGHVKYDVVIVPENVAQQWERSGYVDASPAKGTE